jgi:hypothetical protein
MRLDTPVLLAQGKPSGYAQYDAIVLDFNSGRRVSAFILAAPALLRLPRPILQLLGEVPVLPDFSSAPFAFSAVLPALTAMVLRRSSSPALPGVS